MFRALASRVAEEDDREYAQKPGSEFQSRFSSMHCFTKRGREVFKSFLCCLVAWHGPRLRFGHQGTRLFERANEDGL